MKLNKSVLLFLITGLTACSLTSLPSHVQDSIGENSHDIESATAKIKNAKNIKKNNFIQHTNVGYFSNHAIIENNTDFLPPIFNDEIQIDKQFGGIYSIASGITDLTKISTILDLSSDTDNGVDACTDVRITQQSGDLIDLLDLIASRCDIGWGFRDSKIILFDTETRTWSIKGIPGDVEIQSQIQNNSGAQSQTGGASGT